MKKQTEKQKSEIEFAKKVDKAISDIKLLVKKHGEQAVRAMSEKDRAQQIIQEKEKELAQLKGKYKL